jgi:hypothetical protein
MTKNKFNILCLHVFLEAADILCWNVKNLLYWYYSLWIKQWHVCIMRVYVFQRQAASSAGAIWCVATNTEEQQLAVSSVCQESHYWCNSWTESLYVFEWGYFVFTTIKATLPSSPHVHGLYHHHHHHHHFCRHHHHDEDDDDEVHL